MLSTKPKRLRDPSLHQRPRRILTHRLKGGRVVAQEGAADNGYGRVALAHEVVVKFADGEGSTLFFAQIFAEFHDLQFAQRVVEIRRISGAAFGFDFRDFGRLKTFLDEKLPCLLQSKCSAVHLDAGNESRVAQKRVLQLAETNEARLTQIFRADAGLRVAF